MPARACRKGLRETDEPLKGRMLALIFERPSTRTRVSFEVGMRQLGGETLVLSSNDMQLGRGETIADTARVLSRYVDAIMIRAARHSNLTELAAAATVPVINGLTNLTHPCQVMADVMTLEEHVAPVEGPDGQLGRRRQQCRRLVDSCRGPHGRQAQDRHAEGT